MRHRVYIETTIVSYLTARPSRDLIRAARQQVTSEWWEFRRTEFDLYISEVVLRESSMGDPDAAARRSLVLADLPVLGVTEGAIDLAAALVADGPLPDTAGVDSLHLAVAAVSDMDFLLTWNCRHLANATLRGPVLAFLRDKGYDPPEICTPEELLGET